MSNYKKYFENNPDLLEKLEILHSKKQKLANLIGASEHKETFVAELSGLPRTGKTTTTNRVFNFFKSGGFKISRTIEPARIIKEKMPIWKIRKMSDLEFNDKTLEVSKESLAGLKESNPEIILMDRGIIDNYFWYQMMLKEGKLNLETYESRLLSLVRDLTKVDQLFILSALPEIVIFRDYINQIYLEDRVKTTIERVTHLQEGLAMLLPVIKEHMSSENIAEIDTSEISEIDTSIFVANNILDGMENKIIKSQRK